MSTFKRVITVTADFVAQHRWQACPFDEFAFLRDWHRHKFLVYLTVPVSHGDRQLEFFDVQSKLKKILDLYYGRKFEWSCETFAEQIILNMLERGVPVISCTVSEDGENSATVEVTQLAQEKAKEEGDRFDVFKTPIFLDGTIWTLVEVNFNFGTASTFKVSRSTPTGQETKVIDEHALFQQNPFLKEWFLSADPNAKTKQYQASWQRVSEQLEALLKSQVSYSKAPDVAEAAHKLLALLRKDAR